MLAHYKGTDKRRLTLRYTKSMDTPRIAWIRRAEGNAGPGLKADTAFNKS
jgi:hypothetical protein